jgi:hypothetical protein
MRRIDVNQTLQFAVQNHQHGDLGDAEALYLRHRSMNPIYPIREFAKLFSRYEPFPMTPWASISM